ncbi:hypothetical protein EOL70_19955 [Leucothrix sargassi]|nr:hypothetical protein EOL70_19955 [Leucothrix sargassi]
MAKVYLHVGFHKTASTSFQATCEANVSQLLKQGFIYPSFQYKELNKGKKLFNHTGPIVSAFCESPATYGFNVRGKVKDVEQANEQYLAQLSNALKADKNLIISGEGISSLSEPALKALVTFLSSHGAEVIPVACVRSPYAYQCSAIQTVVKRGNYTNFSTLRSQKDRIVTLQKVFGDQLQFIAFNTACKHASGPVGYLLEYCGIDTSNITFKVKNERQSNEYVRLQNALNKLQPAVIKNKVNNQHRAISPFDGNKFLLNKAELALLEEKLLIENAFFREELGEAFCDETIETCEPSTLDDAESLPSEEIFNEAARLIKLRKRPKLVSNVLPWIRKRLSSVNNESN